MTEKYLLLKVALLLLFLSNISSVSAQCCANGPNLLANYNPDFSDPIPQGGVPPGFQTDNNFNNNQPGAGSYLITSVRAYRACARTPQYDHTTGSAAGKFLWFDTPGWASPGNPAVAWKPYDPGKPAGTQNLIAVTPHTDYVFGVWIRDIGRNADCVSGGAPVMGLRINGVDLAQIDLGIYTTPCCPEWVYLCCPWNSGDSSTARILVESRSSKGWTDLGIDDVYFGTSSAPDVKNALGNDTTICPGDTLVLTSPFPNAQNVWNNTDTGSSLKVGTAGTYWLYVNDNNCEGTDTIVIKAGDPPAFSLGNDTSFCNGNSINIYPKPAPKKPVTYKWYNNSTDSFVNVRGSGIVWLDMSNGCGTTRDSVIVTTEPKPQVFLPEDIEVCLPYGDSIDINAYALPENTEYKYEWTPSDHLRNKTSPHNRFSAPVGDYQLFVTASAAPGCEGTDSMLIHVLTPNILTVQPEDTTIYYGDAIKLIASGADLYRWWPASSLDYPNSATPMASPMKTTRYTVLGINNAGCKDSAFINVNVIFRTHILIPNSFSPNGDGLNDEFKLYNIKYEKLVAFRVFNRWGQLLFETTNPDKGWDGKYKKKDIQSGTYYYYVSVNMPNGTNKIFKGDITLVR